MTAEAATSAGPPPSDDRLALLPRGRPQLDYLPVGLFGSVMGLVGLSVAWRLAEGRYGAPAWIATAIGLIAIAAFVALLAAYAFKIVTAFDAVRAEYKHPIAGNLFGTVLISMLLLPIVLSRYTMLVADLLWIAGAAGMVVFAWLVVGRWMSDRQQVAHATPAWIVPVVSLLDVPIALPSLDLPPLPELSLFALAVGLFFAIPLFTLILSRIVFEPPLPDPLKPSLLILIAPFAVGASAATTTLGRFDVFAEALTLLAFFVIAVLLPLLRDLPLCCPFRVSWWAVSFPLAASAISALRLAAARPGLMLDAISIALLALASIVIAGLAARTLFGVARGELRTLSS